MTLLLSSSPQTPQPLAVQGQQGAELLQDQRGLLTGLACGAQLHHDEQVPPKLFLLMPLSVQTLQHLHPLRSNPLHGCFI